ncbi:4-phosphoerythronate dehydrogenase [Fodinibius sp. AD559]|uniref:4-phosphoerythronate dehydrogenase n=1 Tax=Fodinibius sp. AD559 TaxID=3424179 RepID=UPI004046DA94
MINVLADQYLYNIQSYLPESVNLQLFDPAQGLPSEIDQAHALLIRTVIPINKQTLPNIPKNLTFIGTGSSGTDHVNRQYLAEHNIHFADAAGCNARSVAEYIATALLLWSEKRNIDLSNLSVGIIGVGHVGTEVIDILNSIGLQTVAYDPPRAYRDPDFATTSLDEVLSCDILSFHTPLNRGGKYPTFHWLDEKKLSENTFHLIINSARGGVVDESALLAAMKKGTVRDAIIDTWEDEPKIHLETAGAAFLKTPHIAGYSVQAKENASKFVADKLINFFELDRPDNANEAGQITLKKELSQFDSLSSLLTDLHPIKKYEKRLAAIIRDHPETRGELFNKLRAEFPLRQQFTHIKLPSAYFKHFPVLKALGFSKIN